MKVSGFTDPEALADICFRKGCRCRASFYTGMEDRLIAVDEQGNIIDGDINY